MNGWNNATDHSLRVLALFRNNTYALTRQSRAEEAKRKENLRRDLLSVPSVPLPHWLGSNGQSQGADSVVPAQKDGGQLGNRAAPLISTDSQPERVIDGDAHQQENEVRTGASHSARSDPPVGLPVNLTVDQEPPKQLSPPCIRIRCISGTLPGEICSSQHPFHIGRRPGVNLYLDDSSVSRTHAVIWHESGDWWLGDHGSKHGTFLNGVRLQRHQPVGPLRESDVVQFAMVVFVVESIETVPASISLRKAIRQPDWLTCSDPDAIRIGAE